MPRSPPAAPDRRFEPTRDRLVEVLAKQAKLAMANSVFGLGPEFRAPVRRREGPRSSNNVPFSTPFRAGQFGVAGSPVTPERGRVGAVPVGGIDGPYDAGGLAGVVRNPPILFRPGSC